jgi:hypothetical protein
MGVSVEEMNGGPRGGGVPARDKDFILLGVEDLDSGQCGLADTGGRTNDIVIVIFGEPSYVMWSNQNQLPIQASPTYR